MTMKSIDTNMTESQKYEISVKGHLDERWKCWFEGWVITLKSDGTSLFTGYILDQATLHGLLKKFRDLNMPLISVNNIAPSTLNSDGICNGNSNNND